MTRRLFIICLISISRLPFSGMSLADERAQTVETNNPAPADPASVPTTQQVHDAIEQMRSPQFSVRQKSLETLQAVNAEQIELLSQAIQNSTENEVAQRCLELLERRYPTIEIPQSCIRLRNHLKRLRNLIDGSSLSLRGIPWNATGNGAWKSPCWNCRNWEQECRRMTPQNCGRTATNIPVRSIDRGQHATIT